MKRSEINAAIAGAEAFFARYCFALPPWASWSPARWTQAGPECAEIARAGLGWDVTDFGHGDFSQVGLLLFTLRNGVAGGKPYAEKIMVSAPGQVVPTHFHFAKTEDIIVRGGGRLVIQLWAADEAEGLGEAPVTVSVDGVTRTVPAGAQVILERGESITLTPRLYHAFWGESGGESVLVGEVSSVNDDVADNRFLDPRGRFPAIDEDEAPYRLLCTEYPRGVGA